MEYADIGQTIKHLRIRKGLSAQELAAKVHLTQGYLSKIENSETPPPIPTLIKIAYVLNVHISYFFGEQKGQEHLVLIRENERQEVVRDFTLVGCTYEMILHKNVHNTSTHVYVLTIPSKIHPETLPYNSHDGEEFLYVLEGEMTFYYGHHIYHVQKGDSLSFKAHIPHKAICTHEYDAVKMLMIVSFVAQKEEL